MLRLLALALPLPLLSGCVAAIGVGANQLSDERDLRRETARRYQVPEESVVIGEVEDKTVLSTFYRAEIDGRPYRCRFRAIGVSCQPLSPG